MEPVFIGIDVAKDRLDVHVQPAGEAFTVARDEAGLADLVRRLEAVRPVLIALEATGGYETAVAATVATAGLPVVVVNHIRWLERTLHELEGDIDTTLRSSPLWRATEDLLRPVPGIGPITASTLIADLHPPRPASMANRLTRKTVAQAGRVAPMAAT